MGPEPSPDGLTIVRERSGPDAPRPDRLPLSSSSIPLLVASLAAVVIGQGGFYAPVRAVVAVGLAAAAIASIGCAGAGASRWLRPTGFATASLAAWAVLRSVGSREVTPGLTIALTILAVMVVARLTADADSFDRQLLGGVLLLLGLVVAVTGWIGVAGHITPWAMTATSTWRASTVLTYPNAAAALLVLTLLVVVADRASAGRTQVTALVAWIHLVGIGATQSRGGALALVVGVIVLAVTIGGRRVLAALAGPALGALVSLAALVPSLPDAAAARPLLALGGALGGGVVVAIGARATDRMLARAGAFGVLVGAAAAVVLIGSGSARSDRLQLTSPDRALANELARDAFADHPVVGVGPGQLDLVWSTRDAIRGLQFVHNEYLQFTAELGLVGAALIALIAAQLGRSLYARRRSADVAGWSAAVAGLAAFGVHSAFDFLWHIPTVPLIAAAIVGLGVAPPPALSNVDQSPPSTTTGGATHETSNQASRRRARSRRSGCVDHPDSSCDCRVVAGKRLHHLRDPGEGEYRATRRFGLRRH